MLRRMIAAVIPRPLRDRCWDIAAAHFFPEPLLRRPDAGFTLSLDILLAYYRYSCSSPAPLRYCQVGAFNGVMQDPVFPLIEKYNLTGILLEPQPQPFEELRRNYARFQGFKLINAAISDRNGTQTLYKVRHDAKGPEWLHGIASFDKSVLLRHAGSVPGLESMLETQEVRAVTFATLFEECGVDRLDFLQIDTEGYDGEILRLFDFERYKVPIVNFEHKHLSRQDSERSLSLLIDHGYKIAIGRQGDTLACLASVFGE
jgi:FkbM family methyltransferase